MTAKKPLKNKKTKKSTTKKKSSTFSYITPQKAQKIKAEITDIINKVENSELTKKVEKLLEKLQVFLIQEGKRLAKNGKQAVKTIKKRVLKTKTVKATKKPTKPKKKSPQKKV